MVRFLCEFSQRNGIKLFFSGRRNGIACMSRDMPLPNPLVVGIMRRHIVSRTDLIT